MNMPKDFFEMKLHEMLTAIGTVGSVIISLWLALRSQRPSINMECYIVYISSEEYKNTPFFTVIGTNTNIIDITIDGLYWELDFGPKKCGQYPYNNFCDQFPKTIKYGEQFAFRIPLGILIAQLSQFSEYNFYSASFCMKTTVGKIFKIRIPWRISSQIRKSLRQLKHQKECSSKAKAC